MKKETGAQCAEATARAFFRTINVQAHETLAYLDVDHKGAIMLHPTARTDAFEAGRQLISGG
jgi:hypothetical protein